MSRLVIVSNRVPTPRERNQAAGGLAVALKDAVAAQETLWFGWSGRTCHGAPGAPQVTHARRLTQATIDIPASLFGGYYEGFSNGTLWPLMHWRAGLAEFSRENFEAYMAVNEQFADALAPLLRPGDLVWVHDYHLIPLGRMLRERCERIRLGFFLHIPFPPAPLFETLPQSQRLLKAFGAYQLVGTQTKADAMYLAQALRDAEVGALVEAFPIGIDAASFANAAVHAASGPEVERLHGSLGDRTLILGVDRLDYTKGIPERFRGYAKLLRRFPQHRNRVTFLQVAPVSRGAIGRYRALRRELDELAGRINGENAEFDWTPLRYITRAIPRTTLAGFHRLARVGLVTPLRDGMNLVAKEFVAAQDPENPGALVLSQFAGAAEELDGALLVNPHDPDELAEVVDAALSMPLEERQRRWRSMHETVQRGTARAWARSFLDRLEEAT
ncbi:MAG TPA: trehalose-6-phosphate synthase [Acetobacteraceae bacterium]|nr:trehalose-6-phosphate synthase [Acetobacteraceae bacterium]